MAKEFTLFSHAVRNLKRRPMRATILVVAMGLLVCVFVFALSFVRRVDASIRVTSERLGADLLVVPTGWGGAAEDVLLDSKVRTFYMDRSIIDRVKRIEGIERVTAQTYLATIAGACCDVPETLVVAFDQESDFLIRPWLNEKLGRKLQRGEAIVGSESALNIGLGLTEIDSVLFGNVFKVVGALDRTGTGLDNAIFVDESNIGDILKNGKAELKAGRISVIFAKVERGQDPRRVAGRIEDSIIETDTVARRDVGKKVVKALADINRMFLITFVLASLLAAFLAWAVFSGVANERAREVGLMRAIGAKESHVVKLFLLEVIILGAIGSLAGVFSGTFLSFVLVDAFAILKSVSTELSIGERSGIALSGLVIGTAICVVGALSPIRRAGKLEPLIVLKGD